MERLTLRKVSAWLKRLKVGTHVHLDEVLVAAPPPGSNAWLPILTELLSDLAHFAGAWTVSMPVGTLKMLPTQPITAEELFALADQRGLLEPPAVYRLRSDVTLDSWEGEHHRWSARRSQSVMEVISVSRPNQEALAEEDFQARLVFEIRNPRSFQERE